MNGIIWHSMFSAQYFLLTKACGVAAAKYNRELAAQDEFSHLIPECTCGSHSCIRILLKPFDVSAWKGKTKVGDNNSAMLQKHDGEERGRRNLTAQMTSLVEET